MANDKMKQIEAEMARFETEINTGPAMGNPLQFMPHSMIHRMPRPPMMAGMPPGMPPMPMPPFGLPPMPEPPKRSGPIIEAGPTRYLPHGVKSAAASGVSHPESLEARIRRGEGMGMGMDMMAGSSQQTLTSRVLQKDIEAVEAKRIQEKAFKNSYIGQVMSGQKKMKKFLRCSGGEVWEDSTLAEWDPNDYRLFVGNLGNEVSDEHLAKAFRKYGSFQRCKIVREKRNNKSKGFGFVSFKDANDFSKAMREMDGKYLGNRPVRLRRSNWKERGLDVVKKKVKYREKMGMK